MTRIRWVVMGVFVLSSSLNYLDRQILPALAPALMAEFGMTNADYGFILAAFSIPYALSAPFAGMFIDRVGLNRGVRAAVAIWSAAGIATAFARGAVSLGVCRAALGIGQAGGVPASGKAIATYLKPDERALGNALSQLGMGVGGMLAPPLAIWLALQYGWRSAFVVTGVAGLLWLPLWSRCSRLVPAGDGGAVRAAANSRELLRDGRLWAFVAAIMLSMTVYSLWTNWVTVFLEREYHLPLAETKWYAALPPLFFNAGGLVGGALSLAWMRRGARAVPARLRACFISAVALVATAAVPWAPSAGIAAAAICFSAFWSSALSVNLYTMPLDVYGPARAAFAVSMLTGGYGVMQAAFSPAAGRLIDAYGFAPVCCAVGLLPLAACAILMRMANEKSVEAEA
ncbi:MAG: MFS transporter [bacterium]|jgi:ACS family hexuronate transporter-like MFS transporter